jgi:hypothetical protein
MGDSMQAVGCRQHRLKFWPADFIDQMQGDQSGPRSTALVGGLPSRTGNCAQLLPGMDADAVHPAVGASLLLRIRPTLPSSGFGETAGGYDSGMAAAVWQRVRMDARREGCQVTYA